MGDPLNDLVETCFPPIREATGTGGAGGARGTYVPFPAAKDEQLAVRVVGGRLEISVGVAFLAQAIEKNPDHYDERDMLRVNDPALFAKYVAKELEGNEDVETDLTLIQQALDKAARFAIESDAPGMEWYRPDPCSEEARDRGCSCTMPYVHATDIDPPEPKIDRECPVHGQPYEG